MANVTLMDVLKQLDEKEALLSAEILDALNKYATAINGRSTPMVIYTYRIELLDAILGFSQERVRVGDSAFEGWFASEFDPTDKGQKQQMREAYEAGLNDPVRISSAGMISIQAAWEAAGGNPGIKTSREELLDALRALDEAFDKR